MAEVHFRRLLTLARVALLSLLGAWFPLAHAVPITVVYQGNVIEGQPGVDQGLPYLLSGFPNNLRLRYFVPDYRKLVSIGAFDVSVSVFDDGDSNNNEAGAVLLVLNEIGLPNLEVDCFCDGLNGTTAAAPAAFGGSLADENLDYALLEIQGDGVFFIRVNRDRGDFFVQGAAVTLDGELRLPEPSSLALVFAPGLALLVSTRRRTRACRRC